MDASYNFMQFIMNKFAYGTENTKLNATPVARRITFHSVVEIFNIRNRFGKKYSI